MPLGVRVRSALELGALPPVAEQLEGIAAKAHSTMDAEVRQALADAVAEILVGAKAYDPAFPLEYILSATPTPDEVESFGSEARELARSYAATFATGDDLVGGDYVPTGNAEEQEAESP